MYFNGTTLTTTMTEEMHENKTKEICRFTTKKHNVQ